MDGKLFVGGLLLTFLIMYVGVYLLTRGIAALPAFRGSPAGVSSRAASQVWTSAAPTIEELIR
jgi:putative methionine-R-sulfoxide reductase with GAF domain